MTDPVGPDIELSNKGQSITRTNSSGWGNAFWSTPITNGCIQYKIHIDNDGDSSYLYIGFIETAKQYPLDDVLNSS
ncbi:MAG: hypothetical protein V2I33_26250 [Kangiellaceae bacterium]|jgi:hypothetical protein|nr:hypothetical protein [Kangiellaceae bacterium]